MLYKLRKVKKQTDFTQSIILNPLDFILDVLIRVLAHLLIPFPVATEIIIEFKGILLVILLNTILVICVFVVIILGMFTHPSLVQKGLVGTDISLSVNESFISTDTPLQNPLGGEGLSLVKITAGFMDPSYIFFGGVHTGVDFVPDDTYYNNNTVYKNTGEIIVYSTINGTVNYYIDQYGSHTVEVTNQENTIRTIFMHLNKVFVSNSETITAGKPIGTMGDTGFTTGEHLHYEIRVNNSGTWIPVNPLSYIH